MRSLPRTAIVGIIGLALATMTFVAHAESTPLVLKGFSSKTEGPDRRFAIDIQNTAKDDLTVHGRLVAISVYEATPATVMGIPNTTIAAGETKHFETVWQGAPFVGRVRTLLVITDGHAPSLVTSSDFWILPVRSTAMFAGGLAALIVLVLALMRLPVYLRQRMPENMVAYRVEPGDSVVTISVRYAVTWQEIVKANKLKPPYDIKAGKRIFIPKHSLMHPKKEEPVAKAEHP